MGTPEDNSPHEVPELHPEAETEQNATQIDQSWGDPGHDPDEPLTDAPAGSWFRRPRVLLCSIAVLVVVVVGLVAALVLTGQDGEDATVADTAQSSATITTTEAPSAVTSGYSAADDAAFLRNVDPLLRLYADDNDLFAAAAIVCHTPKVTSKETGKVAIIFTAREIARWKGIDGPTEEDSTYSMPQSLADDAANFAVTAEAAYCPGEVSDGSTGL
ncbi:MAG: hypothetical protein ACTH1D_02795 [Mycobacteriaceae bacterium]